MKHALKGFVLLLVALAIVRLAVMVVAPVFDPSEGRYAAICANMAESGDFLVPRFIHNRVFQSFDGKPPLLFLRRGGLRLRDRAPTTLFSWGIVAITVFWCLTSRVPLAYLLPVVPLFAARLALQDLPPWTARAAPAAVGICIVALVGTIAATSLGSDKMPGWRFRVLRAAGVRTPIIVLSARGSVEAKVTGLEAGGDDYLAKPFSITELVARVQALLRRASATPEATALREADLEVDVVTHRVTRAGRRIDLSLDTLPEGVRLVVVDTGCGISAADLPHIYTRFWRADASRSLPGNGLGLALVKAIVTSYGGRLHCDSVPGQGSAFTVVLPTDG